MTNTTAPQLTSDMSQQEAALAMAEVSWYVFPADHPELPMCAGPPTGGHDPATCDQRGKHPVIKWATGASTSVQTITYWWSGNPRNVGIRSSSRHSWVTHRGPGRIYCFQLNPIEKIRPAR